MHDGRYFYRGIGFRPGHVMRRASSRRGSAAARHRGTPRVVAVSGRYAAAFSVTYGKARCCTPADGRRADGGRVLFCFLSLAADSRAAATKF